MPDNDMSAGTVGFDALRGQLENRVSENVARYEDAKTYLDAIFEHSHDGIGVVDEQGRFEHGNPASFRIVGWPREALIGEFFLKIFSPERHPFMLERWAEVQRGATTPYETEILAQNGDRRHLLISHRRMIIGGRPKYAVVLADITRQKHEAEQLRLYGERMEQMVADRTAELSRANEHLRRSRAALATAQAIAHLGSYEWDPAAGRLEWSDEMFRLHGFDPAMGLPPIDVIRSRCHPDDLEAVEIAMNRSFQTGEPLDMTYRLRLAGGAIRYVQACATRQRVGDCGVVIGTLLDITRQRLLEHEVVETSQREQARIGADIHDSLGQELTALSLMAKALSGQLHACCPDREDDARDLYRLAQATVRHAKALAYGLTPVDIESGGLECELRRLVAQESHLHGIPVGFRSRVARECRNREQAAHLYYIAREAIHNALRHAGANTVHVSLIMSARRCRLTVRDDGRWRDREVGSIRGAGLRIMRHRADIVGARLTIVHGQGQGTRVICAWRADGGGD